MKKTVTIQKPRSARGTDTLVICFLLVSVKLLYTYKNSSSKFTFYVLEFSLLVDWYLCSPSCAIVMKKLQFLKLYYIMRVRLSGLGLSVFSDKFWIYDVIMSMIGF